MHHGLLDWGLEEYRTTNAIPTGGFGQLIRNASLGLDIRLGKEVEKICHGSHGVAAWTQHEEFAGDLALVTVPLGVLKSHGILFDPPLDLEKRGAIDRIGYGGRSVLNKIILRFPQRFWPESSSKLAALPTDRHKRGVFPIWTDDLPTPGEARVLTGFSSGAVAAHFDLNLSDEETRAEALMVLQRMFGRFPDPNACSLTRWLSDPWARGSYSFAAVGSSDDDCDRLARPVDDRLFFAGEATDRQHYGTVQGALRSGGREALRIHTHYCCAHRHLWNLPWRKV